VDNAADKDTSRRVIKRYSNRKLYDTRDSRYVTLLQIAEMVRAGEDVQIIDNTTKEDKTEVTLALAISEELKTRPRAVSVGSLRTLIQERGEKLLETLREGPIGRLIPGQGHEDGTGAAVTPEGGAVGAPVTEVPADAKHDSMLAEIVATSRNTLEQWQHAMDERIRTVIPGLKEHTDLLAEVRRLAQRVEALEAQLGTVTTVESTDKLPASEPAPRVEYPEAAATGPSAQFEMRADPGQGE
jgi:polyhydroxyalkanoate synthesis repressor PhaR